MNSTVRAAWAAALSDPAYYRDSLYLKTLGGYDILGVLCDLYVKAVQDQVKPDTEWESESDPWPPVWTNSGHGFFSLRQFTDKLPECVQRWADLDSQNPTLILSDSNAVSSGASYPIKLSELNDGLVLKKVGETVRPYTWAEIGILISAQLLNPDEV